jgi:protease-4
MDDQPPPIQPSQSPPPPQPLQPPVAPPPIICSAPVVRSKGGALWKILTFVFLGLLCLSILSRSLGGYTRVVAPRSHAQIDRSRGLEETILEQAKSDNKIAVISIDGVITGGMGDHSGMNMVDFVAEQLKAARTDSDVKAVVLKVNSPGGEVLASDEINNAIRKFEDESRKPVVVSMGALAASGGYYVSAPCRWIVANELTLTGSIGVIMDSWNYRELMDKVGIRPHVFKSGRFKDMLSGEREPDTNKLSSVEQKDRQEEDRMVQSLINETYNKFKSVVQNGRGRAAEANDGQGRSLVKNWTDYADGRVLSGKHALELGFVDELGDFDVAVKRAKTLAHISDASLVGYYVVFDFQSVVSHLFGKTETPALKIDLGMGAPSLEAGRLYYILPTTVLH